MSDVFACNILTCNSHDDKFSSPQFNLINERINNREDLIDLSTRFREGFKITKTNCPHLSRLECRVCNLQNDIRPHHMQTQHQNEKTIEDVVSRKHWKNSGRFNGTAVDDAWIETQSGNNPYDGECGKQTIANLLVFCVFGNFSSLKNSFVSAMWISHPSRFSFTSNRMSAQSCTTRTSEPTRCKLHTQLRAINSNVIM